jgi:hypothetical protein
VSQITPQLAVYTPHPNPDSCLNLVSQTIIKDTILHNNKIPNMENIKVTDSRMYGLVALYDMHTGFFRSVTEGINDTDSHKRLETKANHIAWLTGSLVQQRYELAQMLGNNEKQKADELFRENKGIQDGVIYPSMTEFLSEWERISPILRDTLINVSTEKLDSIFEVPGMKFPYFDLISFIIYREANCIGQIALWRRLLGYDPMKYM